MAAATGEGDRPALALEVIEFALTDMMDVGIVVSLDRDLHEIPLTLRNLRKHLPHPVRLEAAVPVRDTLKFPKTLTGFSHTHQITPEVFTLIRDDTNYTVADDQWAPPTPPKTLTEARKRAAARAPGPPASSP